MVVWCLASTEIVSALARKRREGALSASRFTSSKRQLGDLEAGWSEVWALDAVRDRARRLLEVHALTAADALHLAAALVLVEERTRGVGFVTFDDQLGEAAEREGFDVVAG
jgi:predicted nucleic acid-binding protein